MASLNGHALLQWLIERGWEVVPLQQGVLGDPQVKSKDGKVFSLHDAAEEQRKLAGEWPDFLEDVM